jgi:hypothetical protein
LLWCQIIVGMVHSLASVFSSMVFIF